MYPDPRPMEEVLFTVANRWMQVSLGSNDAIPDGPLLEASELMALASMQRLEQ